MTKSSKKKERKEIQERLAEPPSEQSKKDMEEIVYGDDNNPTEKFGTGYK